MSTAIGIFDESTGLEETLARLRQSGLDPESIIVLDPARRRAADSDEGAPGAGDAILPGVAPSIRHAGLAAGAPEEQARAFRSLLGERISDAQTVEHYCRILDHEGVLVIVDTKPAQAESVAGVMRRNGASRVDVHA